MSRKLQKKFVTFKQKVTGIESDKDSKTNMSREL